MTPVTRTPHSCRQRGNRGVSLPSSAPNGANGVPQVPHRSPGRSGLSGWLYYNGNRPIWALTGGGRAQNCGSFACCRQQTGPQTTQRQTWGTCWLLGTGGGRCGSLQEKPLPPHFSPLRQPNRLKSGRCCTRMARRKAPSPTSTAQAASARLGGLVVAREQRGALRVAAGEAAASSLFSASAPGGDRRWWLMRVSVHRARSGRRTRTGSTGRHMERT